MLQTSEPYIRIGRCKDLKKNGHTDWKFKKIKGATSSKNWSSGFLFYNHFVLFKTTVCWNSDPEISVTIGNQFRFYL